jgi:hypothetical protein
MVTTKKISVNELPNLVYLSYLGDDEFIGKYSPHIKGESPNLMQSVNGELYFIYEMGKDKKLNYYKAIYQKKPIGYFVTISDEWLYSFSINKKYRKAEILANWWKQIEKTLRKQFFCCLYENNERAINFIKRNGMKEKERENNTILFVKN